jgi:hypothetical protein
VMGTEPQLESRSRAEQVSAVILLEIIFIQ